MIVIVMDAFGELDGRAAPDIGVLVYVLYPKDSNTRMCIRFSIHTQIGRSHPHPQVHSHPPLPTTNQPTHPSLLTPHRAKYPKKRKRKRTLKSTPELFKLAQSNELCPGANATFSLFFGESVGGLSVVGGGMRLEPAEDEGTPREEEEEEPGTRSVEDEEAGPGARERDEGTGGGGMRVASVRMRGIAEDEGDRGWRVAEEEEVGWERTR